MTRIKVPVTGYIIGFQRDEEPLAAASGRLVFEAEMAANEKDGPVLRIFAPNLIKEQIKAARASVARPSPLPPVGPPPETAPDAPGSPVRDERGGDGQLGQPQPGAVRTHPKRCAVIDAEEYCLEQMAKDHIYPLGKNAKLISWEKVQIRSMDYALKVVFEHEGAEQTQFVAF